MGATTIEWADKTWNPVTGCSPVSEGCANCYAARMAKCLRGRYGYPADEPFRVTLHPERLDEPLHWRKPSMVFVCSMGDLFHEDVPEAFIRAVFVQMAKTRRVGHTFLVLTKRPKRMQQVVQGWIDNGLTFHEGCTYRLPSFIWLGVTAENQDAANERIPIILQIPAAKRFVSCEPLLGPVKLRGGIYGPDWLEGWAVESRWDGNPNHNPEPEKYQTNRLDWVICGGETGPGARPMHPDWARSLRDQCQQSGTPFFFKQWGTGGGIGSALPGHPLHDAGFHPGQKGGGRLLDGREWNEMPEVIDDERD